MMFCRRSAPAQKWPPAPVSTTQRTSRVARRPVEAPSSAPASTARVSALRASGRLMVTMRVRARPSRPLDVHVIDAWPQRIRRPASLPRFARRTPTQVRLARRAAARIFTTAPSGTARSTPRNPNSDAGGHHRQEHLERARGRRDRPTMRGVMTMPSSTCTPSITARRRAACPGPCQSRAPSRARASGRSRSRCTARTRASP